MHTSIWLLFSQYRIPEGRQIVTEDTEITTDQEEVPHQDIDGVEVGHPGIEGNYFQY